MYNPLTPRRASNRKDTKTPKKTPPAKAAVDVGAPLGPYDNNTVRDRVRQWQAQGGGVVHATDCLGGDDGDDHKPEVEATSAKKPEEKIETPKPKDAVKAKKVDSTEGKKTKAAVVEKGESAKKAKSGVADKGESATPERRSGRRKDRDQEKKRVDMSEYSGHRSVSAPRKRVVSDTNWRKRGAQSAKKPDPLSDDGIRVRSMPDPKVPRKSEMVGDGIRVYSTPPGSRRQSGAHRKRTVAEDNDIYDDDHDEDNDGSSESSLVFGTPERSEDSDDGVSGSEKGVRRKKKTPEASPPVVQKKSVRKSSKGGIFSQVLEGPKKIFSRSEPVVVTPPRIPTIEAWLNGTPDPFLDSVKVPLQDVDRAPAPEPEPEPEPEPTIEEEMEELPVEIPAPLKTSSRRRRRHEAEEIRAKANRHQHDPNGIWEALGSKESPRRSEGSRRRQRDRTASAPVEKPITEVHESDQDIAGVPRDPYPNTGVNLEESKPDFSPPSLKRTGARRGSATSSSPKRARRKSSPLKESVSVAEGNTFNPAASAISSANTSSSVDPNEDPILPLRGPGLFAKKQFPSLGRHRLSTIASVETFGTEQQKAPPAPTASFISSVTDHSRASSNTEAASEARDHFDPNSLERRSSKSRVTKHADLISVLSIPDAAKGVGRSRSIRSARSVRTNRSKLATASIPDLMTELANDESKYMRELRTLVDGVIPVLLTCVLSKTDSAAAAGLFSTHKAARDNAELTKPIYDMGITLERLKRAHKRISTHNKDAFLTWAHGTKTVYRDYLKAWRMGFQDVVVNLAPAAEADQSSSPTSALDAGLPRNNDGDVVDANGERVDVAFLLKRPLVRLKYLAKTLKGINFVTPSAEAETLSNDYQDLVTEARHRSNEERARLEDEAAASIDPTRARDLRTLGPLAGVSIDITRRVRARDYFNLSLFHTSGQRIDCRVELIIRDDPAGSEAGGDVLICEVDGTGKWLFFPPVHTSKLSARNGDAQGEIVVMIRGMHSAGQEWHEILSLTSEDEQAGFEWVQMLGLTPVPPKLMRTQSFIARSERRKTLTLAPPDLTDGSSVPTTPVKSRTPSPRDLEVPIGEQASGIGRSWKDSPSQDEALFPVTSLMTRDRNRLQKKPVPQPTSAALVHPMSSGNENKGSETGYGRDKNTMTPETAQTPTSLNDALDKSGSPLSGLRRARAQRHSKSIDEAALKSPESPDNKSSPQADNLNSSRPMSLPSQSPGIVASKESRPKHDRSKSSAPSLDLPIIPKVRKDSPPTTPIHDPEEEPVWPQAETPTHPPKKLRKKRSESADSPPPPPPHRTPSPVQVGNTQTPDLGSSVKKTHRRSSSPLKHEYEPSTASDSSIESDASTVEHNDVTSVSDSSEDEDLEDGDAPTPLLPFGALNRLPKSSSRTDTIGPSQSASQAPYRAVPAQASKAVKTVATILIWSDKGAWDKLWPDECSISVTPGLIEAFEMSPLHSQAGQPGSLPISESSPNGPKPLIAIELTPLVLLRRGTAIDISIRCIPTSDSRLPSLTDSNILFRSRNPAECEALYGLINFARINNPTYLALQNARATSFAPQFGGATFNRGSSTRGSRSSWFGFGGKSGYRASSAPTRSVAHTETSVGSMSSAFSALRRFGNKSSRFSIARSTVTSRQGSRANSVYTTSASENSSGSGTSTPHPGLDGKGATAPIGLSNAKIRLYIRVSQNKWHDLGSARLTIMRPTNTAHPPAPGLLPTSDPAGASTPPLLPAVPAPIEVNAPAARQTANDKRIIVVGKTGETLLDVTLGESCFEKMARTGIAMSVWEPNEGGMVLKEGGVVGGKFKVYMIQMKSEAETSYTFSIVGKLRY